MTDDVIILGIDPGYDRVGWAVGTSAKGAFSLKNMGICQTKKNDTLFQRYQQIDQEITAVIDQYHPTQAAVESLFFTKNQKTALHVSEARGVILSCLFRHEVAFFEYTPLQIKQAVTGYGKADKQSVEKMIHLYFPQQIRNTRVALIDDTIDAVAVAVTHAAAHKHDNI